MSNGPTRTLSSNQKLDLLYQTIAVCGVRPQIIRTLSDKEPLKKLKNSETYRLAVQHVDNVGGKFIMEPQAKRCFLLYVTP